MTDDTISTIEDKIFFSQHLLTNAIRKLDTKEIQDQSRKIVGLILRREDLMKSEPEVPMEKTIENHIENNILNISLAYQSGDISKAHHLEDELELLKIYQENHPEEHYDPSPLELYCDANPDAVECRIYED